MIEKLGQEPAFPDAHMSITKGMSKRLYIATECIKPLISRKGILDTTEETVRIAYKFADELLKQEND